MILKYTASLLNRIGYRFISLSKKVYQTPKTLFDIAVAKWFADKGDQTLRLNYNLSPDAIVFDLGGFEGQWASDIFSKYCCNIYVFELFDEYAKSISLRFDKNSKIKIHPFGLSVKDEDSVISVAGEGSSIYREGSIKKNVQFKNIKTFLEQNNIKQIDLIKINIEGGEYDLLEYILDEGIANHIKNFQIQFHDLFPESKARMEKIQSRLSKTHKLTYQYHFVWENWELNKNL